MGPLLDEFLASIRLPGARVCGVTASAPWGVELAAAGGLACHVVVEGEALLAAAPGPRDTGPAAEVRLRAGDVALVPSGGRHRLRSGAGATVEPLEVVDRRTVRAAATAARWKTYDGGDGPVCGTVCGTFRLDPALAPLLASALPGVAVADRAALGPAAAALVELIVAEMKGDRPGAPALIERYAEVLLLEALRVFAATPREGAPAGIFAAMREPRIARALAAFHAEPGAAWTVPKLAGAASMSGSAFKAAFGAVLGCPPHAYVLRWRLADAARRLRDTGAGIAWVAEEAGFASPASFGKAFRRAYGTTPGAYRRSSRG